MRVFVGTSGWFYDWNPERSLDWFVARAGLNAIELNASFYRFPFPAQIKSWAKKGAGLRWAVKVSRLITHTHCFNPPAPELWKRFSELFAPLDGIIEFYLFQLPPRLTPATRDTIAQFAEKTNLGQRFALECRHAGWFEPALQGWADRVGITLVSVDAPKLPRLLFNNRGVIYLRLHGRENWYQHNYTLKELKEIVAEMKKAKPERVFAFFNNDQDMLKNARQLLRLLSGTGKA